jgi:hypothetical protein
MGVKTGSPQSNLFAILAHADGSAGRKRGLDRLSVIDWELFRPVLNGTWPTQIRRRGAGPPGVLC